MTVYPELTFELSLSQKSGVFSSEISDFFFQHSFILFLLTINICIKCNIYMLYTCFWRSVTSSQVKVKGKNGRIYVYEVDSFWNKEKKNPDSHRKCIGHIDEQTKAQTTSWNRRRRLPDSMKRSRTRERTFSIRKPCILPKLMMQSWLKIWTCRLWLGLAILENLYRTMAGVCLCSCLNTSWKTVERSWSGLTSGFHPARNAASAVIFIRKQRIFL